MDTRFVFRVDCAHDAVTPKALKRSVETFMKMLESADAQDWRISELGLHSIDLAACPVVNDERAMESVSRLERISALAAKESPAPSDVEGVADVVVCIRDLIRDCNCPITLVVADTANTFTSETMDKLSPLLDQSGRTSFGHVRGIVDKVILQERHRSLGLVDAVTTQRVDVRFAKNLDAVVRGINVGATVDAMGWVQRARRIVTAEDIRIVTEEHGEPVMVSDLEGILNPDFTGGMGSVDFVSSLRDSRLDEDMHIGGTRD